jgi:tetratricopeptide (TPR) repeat protein
MQVRALILPIAWLATSLAIAPAYAADAQAPISVSVTRSQDGTTTEVAISIAPVERSFEPALPIPELGSEKPVAASQSEKPTATEPKIEPTATPTATNTSIPPTATATATATPTLTPPTATPTSVPTATPSPSATPTKKPKAKSHRKPTATPTEAQEIQAPATPTPTAAATATEEASPIHKSAGQPKQKVAPSPVETPDNETSATLTETPREESPVPTATPEPETTTPEESPNWDENLATVPDTKTPAPTPSARIQPSMVEVRTELTDIATQLVAARASKIERSAPEEDRSEIGARLSRRLVEIKGEARTGHREKAQRDLVKLAATFPESQIAPVALYEAAALERSSLDERLRMFKNVFDKYPASYWALKSVLEIGKDRYQQGDFPAALDAFRAYVILKGEGYNDPPLRMNIVVCLAEMRHYSEVLEESDRLIAEYPQYANYETVLAMRGDSMIALERYREAIFTIRTLLHENPVYEKAPKELLLLGLCYEELGQFEAAREIYAQIVKAFPVNRADVPFESLAAKDRLDFAISDPFGFLNPRKSQRERKPLERLLRDYGNEAKSPANAPLKHVSEDLPPSP